MAFERLTSTEEAYSPDCRAANAAIEALEPRFRKKGETRSEASVSKAIAKYVDELNSELLSADALDSPPHVGKPVALLDSLSPWFRVSTIADVGAGVERVELFDSHKLSPTESKGTTTTSVDVNNFFRSAVVNFGGESGEGMGMTIELADPTRVCAELMILQYLTKRAKGMITPIMLDYGWYSPNGAVAVDGGTTVFFRDSVFGYLKNVEEKYDAAGQLNVTLNVTLETVKTLGLLDKRHMQPYYVFAQNSAAYVAAVGAAKLVAAMLADMAKSPGSSRPMHAMLAAAAKYDMCSRSEAIAFAEAVARLFSLPASSVDKAATAFKAADAKSKYRLDGFSCENVPKAKVDAAASVLSGVVGFPKKAVAAFARIASTNVANPTPGSLRTAVDAVRSLAYECAIADESDPRRKAALTIMRTVIASFGARTLVHPALVARFVVDAMTSELSPVLGTSAGGGDAVTVVSPIFHEPGQLKADSFSSDKAVVNLFSHRPASSTAFTHPAAPGAKAVSLGEYCSGLGREFCSKDDYAKFGVDNSVYAPQPMSTWFEMLAAVFSHVHVNMRLDKVTSERLGIAAEGATERKKIDVPVRLRMETQTISLYGKDGSNEALPTFVRRISTLFSIATAMASGRAGGGKTVEDVGVSFKPPRVSKTEPYATWYFALLTIDNGAMLTQDPLLSRYVAAYSYRAGGSNTGFYDPGHGRAWDVDFPDVASFEPTFSLTNAMNAAGSLARQTVKGAVADGVVIDTVGERLKTLVATLESLEEATRDGGKAVEDRRGEWEAALWEAGKIREAIKNGASPKPVLDNFTYTVNANEHSSSVDHAMAIAKTHRDMQRLAEYVMLHPSGGFSVEGQLKTYGNPYFSQQTIGAIVFLKYIQQDGSIGLLTGNYVVMGATHTLEPGAFWTTLKLRGLGDRSAERTRDLYEHLYEKKALRRAVDE